ncbi:hypothetical protein NFI96_018266, partial [Prochilodus magdalenae]
QTSHARLTIPTPDGSQWESSSIFIGYPHIYKNHSSRPMAGGEQISSAEAHSGFGGARHVPRVPAEAKTKRGALQLLLSVGFCRGGERREGGEFSFMHRSISPHMPAERSRNKELLEASVAWLWELEELRERQHSLVLTALALGDPPAGGELEPELGGCVEPEEWAFRRRLNRLQDAPNGLMQVLQQQFSELRVDTCDQQSAEEDLDSPSSSGFYEQSETQSPPRRSSSSPSLSFSSHKPRSVDAYLWDWENQREPAPRTVLPRSFSAPYPPLEGIAEGTEEEEDDDNNEDEDDIEDGALWSEGQVVNGDSMDRHEMGLTVGMSEGPIGEVGVDPTVDVDGPTEELDEGPVEEVDEGPTEEDIQQAMRVEAYILGLLQRCSLNPTPSPSAELNSNRWQDLHGYPPITPNYCDPTPGHSEWQEWAALNEEEDGEESQERYYMSHLDTQDGPSSLVCEDLESSLEMEQYRGMKPCSSSSDVDSLQHQRGYLEHHASVLDPVTSSRYIHTHISPPATLESAEQDWASRLARMHQEDRWGSVEERHARTTSRSQSEGSFPPQGWTAQPEHRYFTVGRGRATHRIDEDCRSNQRLWCSSAELNQEEEESLLRGEEPMVKYTSLPFHTYPQACTQYTEQSHHLRNQTSARAARGDGSDSSLSETCSPKSSSVSSDSDESGGLVWPQQLPPRLPPASSQNAPSSVVKIKASHALKRKIMRFRSGSLKVMTTV